MLSGYETTYILSEGEKFSKSDGKSVELDKNGRMCMCGTGGLTLEMVNDSEKGVKSPQQLSRQR